MLPGKLSGALFWVPFFWANKKWNSSKGGDKIVRNNFECAERNPKGEGQEVLSKPPSK